MPAPPALILGAGSQIAPFLSARLAAAGYTGQCVSRTPPPAQPPLSPAFAWHSLDVEHPGAWAAPAQAIVFATLPLWLLPPFLPHLHGARQLIAFSSTSVFAKAHSPDPEERALAERLRAAEAALAAGCAREGLRWTLLRPTLIYGSGRDQNVSAIARFIRRFGFFPLAAPGRGLRQPVHADDLAQAAVAALDNPRARDRAFDLPGGETLTYRAMVERIFAHAGKRPRILPLPGPLPRAGLFLGGGLLPYRYSPALFLRMNEDLCFDAAAAHAALGYRPRGFLQEPLSEEERASGRRATLS